MSTITSSGSTRTTPRTVRVTRDQKRRRSRRQRGKRSSKTTSGSGVPAGFPPQGRDSRIARQALSVPHGREPAERRVEGGEYAHHEDGQRQGFDSADGALAAAAWAHELAGLAQRRPQPLT